MTSVGSDVHDDPEQWPTSASQTRFVGGVITVRQERVHAPDGSTSFLREVVRHPGAVGIIALDEQQRVLVVHQYRHPVGHRLVEAPAGLLDHDGEPYQQAAARELYEEGHVLADDWRVLVDLFTSPGMSNETLRIYLARGLSEVPAAERHVGVDEEADMATAWIPLAALVQRVLDGRLHNPTICAGVLATHAAIQGAGLDALRAADAGWASREALPD